MRTTQQLDAIARAMLSPGVRAAVVRDGWPAAMVEAGFAMHRKTWVGLRTALYAELSSFAPDERSVILSAQPSRTVAHLWPALPGAGVAPALFGFLLGVGEQWIKPSSRGLHFARAAVDAWQSVEASSVRICADDWVDADHIIVSGDDTTVEAVVDRAGAERVVGYGHRVSGALIVDDGDAERWAPGLATDIVMWHQLGCFSARGIIFVGSDERAESFASTLAGAISNAEAELDAVVLDEATATHRMQRLGQAEFETRVWKSRVGWVERRPRWDGAWISRHAVSISVADDPTAAFDLIDVGRDHLQGFSLGTPDDLRGALTLGLVDAGATRVCEPGALQAPEPGWLHDGHSNVRALAGPGVGRVGDNVGAQQTPDRVG